MSNFNRIVVDERATRYDPFTILLHWLTALLVLTLFGLAQVWDFADRGTPLRLGLISLHVSLGILPSSLSCASSGAALRIGAWRPLFPGFSMWPQPSCTSFSMR